METSIVRVTFGRTKEIDLRQLLSAHGFSLSSHIEGGYSGLTRHMIDGWIPFRRVEIVDDGGGNDWTIHVRPGLRTKAEVVAKIFSQVMGKEVTIYIE